MKIEIKDLPKSQKEMTIEVGAQEMEKYTDRAAKRLAQASSFDGFRKGKAPKSMIEKQVGKEGIFEEATHIAIEETYGKAIEEENLSPIGLPKAEIIKAAVGNPFVYKVTIAVIPKIDLWDYKKLKGKAKVTEVKEQRVEEEVKNLQKKRSTFITKDEPAQKGDRVEVDFEARMAGVKIEGGESKSHPLVIGEGRFIPGFEDNIIGMKKDEIKNFSLVFPTEYQKKELAGKNVDFKVEMKLVQKVNMPEINDEFAKGLGKFENLDNLKKSIKDGLTVEEETKAKEEFRANLIDEVRDKSKMEVPDVLIESELNNMINEFRNNVSQTGIEFEEYLKSVNTNLDKLKVEWREMAEKRARTGLVLREISLREKIKVTDEEIEERVNQTLKYYPNEEEVRKNIDIEKFRNYVAGIIVNEKVFETLEKIANENAK